MEPRKPRVVRLVSSCWLAGTRLETPQGEAAVGTILAGDEVIALVDGRRRTRTVRRVTSRRIDLSGMDQDQARHAAPLRIRAHAFADNVPARDLLVSGEHRIVEAEALIPVRTLANQASIIRESECISYRVYELALDGGATLLADGLAVQGPADLDGHAAGPCAAGEAAAPAWHRLAQRARSLAMGEPCRSTTTHTTSDPGLCVRLGTGILLRPIRSRGTRLFFMLPAGADGTALLSRAAVPAEIDGPFVEDRRRLGVCVRRLTLWRGLCSTEFPPAGQSGPGWHPPEPGTGWRWTDGRAALALPMLTQPAILEIDLAAPRLYSAFASNPYRLLA